MSILGRHHDIKISELDELIMAFDANRVDEPESRRIEREKAAAIAHKRDKEVAPNDTNLWEGF